MGKKEKEKKKPAFEARLNQIRVSVWENKSDNGRWFNTTLTRRYKEKDSDDYKDAHTFSGIGDLALCTEAVRLASTFIAGEELE